MENEKQGSDSEKSRASPIDIAIVGGGIAGLYCALQCGEKYNGKKTVELFEMSDRFGGRIWTEFFPDQKHWEFAAEFGPMRIEPDHQPCLKGLLNKLDIFDPEDAPKASKASKEFDEPAWLIKFPPYSSPPTPNEPDY